MYVLSAEWRGKTCEVMDSAITHTLDEDYVLIVRLLFTVSSMYFGIQSLYKDLI